MKTKEPKPFPKKLADIKDDHGTSLQSYAESIMEKSDAAGLLTFMAFLSPDGNLFTTISNISIHDQPDFLHRVAADMKKPKSSRTFVPSQLKELEA